MLLWSGNCSETPNSITPSAICPREYWSLDHCFSMNKHSQVTINFAFQPQLFFPWRCDGFCINYKTALSSPLCTCAGGLWGSFYVWCISPKHYILKFTGPGLETWTVCDCMQMAEDMVLFYLCFLERCYSICCWRLKCLFWAIPRQNLTSSQRKSLIRGGMEKKNLFLCLWIINHRHKSWLFMPFNLSSLAAVEGDLRAASLLLWDTGVLICSFFKNWHKLKGW